MTEIKLIRQLPDLEDHQGWACENGCSDIQPKLHRHVYSESWDTLGYKLHEKAEHYYTCGKGHVLSVWDDENNDYVTLPDEAYKPRENTFNLTLEHLDGLKKELDLAKAKYNNLGKLTQYLKVSFELNFEDGSTLTIDENYLNEMKASLTEDLFFTTHEDA